MKRIIIIAVYLLLTVATNATPSIISSLNIYIGPEQERLFEFNKSISDYYPAIYSYSVSVKQELLIDDYDKDTLILKLNRISPYKINGNSYFNNISNINITTINPISNIYTPLEFTINENRLLVNLPDRNCHIFISYNLSSDFGFRVPSSTWVYMQLYFSKWQSWYFTTSDMYISEANFYTANNVNVYAYDINRVDTNQFNTKYEHLSEGRQSFILLNKKFYKQLNFNYKTIQIECLFAKDIAADTLEIDGNYYYTLSPITGYNSTRDNLPQELFESIKYLIEFFNVSIPYHITVADGDIYFLDANNEIFRWGNMMDCGNQNFCLIIDKTMWETHSLVHEIIHTFIQYAPPISSSFYYFFNESMVEYLAVCSFYKDLDIRNEIFQKKKRYYEAIYGNNSDSISIKNLKNNYVNLTGNQTGPSVIIYEKTPYLIHLFAQSIGEDKFMKLLHTFYKEMATKKRCSIDDFKEILLSSGYVTQEQLENFIDSI